MLVSVGKENIYLSTEPEITFFKLAYRRYTNYSIEPTPQYFKTTPDFGRRCTVNISKNADLMWKTYLYVELPSIQQENFSTNVTANFAWVNKIGMALINFVELEIGGTIVDRHYGDWLNIWNEITISLGLRNSYNKMIGNISTLTQYSATKNSIILYIPLSFWFCLDTGIALPLIALTHNDVKIHLEFNDFSTCYNIQPTSYITVLNTYCLLKPGELFTQTYQNTTIIGSFVSFDPVNQLLYYNTIKGTFTIPTINNDPNYVLIGNTSKFQVNIKPLSVAVTNNNYFKYNTPSIIDAYLLVSYVYLDNFERYHFINNDHEYLVPIVQYLSAQSIYSANASYKLSFYNPVKLIAWRCCLQSNINSNNQFNYTSLPYTSTDEDLITSHTIVINSINRMNLTSNEYYTYVPNYEYEFTTIQRGIYLYSFALDPKDLQPSGTMNFSKIDDAYLQLSMNKIVNYQNPAVIQGYGIHYNLFRISNGIGGLTFNS